MLFDFSSSSLFPGKLTDAFSSLAKKSNFRALSRKLNLVNYCLGEHLWLVVFVDSTRTTLYGSRFKINLIYGVLSLGEALCSSCLEKRLLKKSPLLVKHPSF